MKRLFGDKGALSSPNLQELSVSISENVYDTSIIPVAMVPALQYLEDNGIIDLAYVQ